MNTCILQSIASSACRAAGAFAALTICMAAPVAASDLRTFTFSGEVLSTAGASPYLPGETFYGRAIYDLGGAVALPGNSSAAEAYAMPGSVTFTNGSTTTTVASDAIIGVSRDETQDSVGFSFHNQGGTSLVILYLAGPPGLLPTTGLPTSLGGFNGWFSADMSDGNSVSVSGFLSNISALAPIPEPGSGLLLVLGLGIVAIRIQHTLQRLD
jgi:hypothetical protein